MSRKANWKTWVVLSMAVAVIVASGGLVMGSNLGFKINKAIVQTAPVGSTGFNWTAIPNNSPYPRAKDLCSAVFANASAVTITRVVPLASAACPAAGTCPATAAVGSGSVTSFNCALLATSASNFCMSDYVAGTGNSACQGQARGIRITNTIPVGPPVTVGRVIVGSSNETTPLPAIAGDFGCLAAVAPCTRVTGAAPAGHNWIAVPYHTTWLNAEDLCVTLGLGGFGNTTAPCPGPPTPVACGVNGTGTISRLNAATGAFTNHPCGPTCTGSLISNFNLVLGESVRVTKNPNPAACAVAPAVDLAGVLPPHF